MKLTLLFIALFLFYTAEQADCQWLQSTGSFPHYTYINTLAISGSNLFAGMREGVFLSTDNGTSWVEVNNGLKQPYNGPYVNTIIVSGINIYAGTQDGFFLSTNNGTNWTQSGDITHEVTALAISGTNIYAGTYYGIYISTNNGISWKIANNSPLQTSVNAFVVVGKNLFVGTSRGIFLSSDKGISWIPQGPIKDSVISLTASGTNIFAGTDSGVFLSTNNGNSWNSTGLKNKYVYSFALSGTNIFAGTNDGVFLSTDNGISWAQSGLASSYVYALLANSSSNVFAATTTYGTEANVAISINNGKNWTTKERIPDFSDILNLVVSNNILFASTANRGNFVSQNNGRSWNSAALVLASYYGFSFVCSGTEMFVGTDIGVFLSMDNDTSWSQTSLKNRIVALTISGQNIFAGTDSGIFTSTDKGINWVRVNTGLTRSKNIYSFITSDSNLFAVTDSGVFLSNNPGKNWVNIGLSTVGIKSFGISGTQFFAGTDSGLFLSSNNGLSWARIGFSDTVVWSVAVVGSSIFVSTGRYSTNVFLSTDNGISWKIVNEGLPDGVVVKFLVVLGTELFAGTENNCVWRRPLSEMISVNRVETSSEINSPVTHVQNIPNPFDVTTKIRFDLGLSTFVSLKILDILGREVSILASEELPAGTYTRGWNASAFPPGEYFYRLQAGVYSETKKLMLVK